MNYYVTGDKHQDYAGLFSKIELAKLGENDTIIVLGDMGLFWRNDKKDADAIIKFYEDNYTCNLWFIDGNHENHPLLKALPIVDKLGYVSPHIRYIPRGTVLDLGGCRCLFIGGAESIDKAFRQEGLSWWKDETITEDDISNIENQHYDYVFSHTCPESVFNEYRFLLCSTNVLKMTDDTECHISEKRLEQVKNNISFDNWWFGHFHQDVTLNNNFACLLHGFKKIRNKEEI